MSVSDLLLVSMVLVVGVYLAWRSGPLGFGILFVSAGIISAMLFLSGPQLTAVVGQSTVKSLERVAASTPWSLSDWLHFVIFIWLGALLWLGRPDLRGWKAWGLLVVLAFAAEAAQGLAPGREPRLDDVLLNLAGGMAGLMLAIGCVALTRFFRNRGSMVP